MLKIKNLSTSPTVFSIPYAILFFLRFFSFLIFRIFLFLFCIELLLFKFSFWLTISILFCFFRLLDLINNLFLLFFLVLGLSFLALNLSLHNFFIAHPFCSIMSVVPVSGVFIEHVSIVFLIIHVNRNIWNILRLIQYYLFNQIVLFCLCYPLPAIFYA